MDNNRDFLIELMAAKSKNQPLTVLEIGVWTGFFSQRILKEVQTAELHLIDPWIFSTDLLKTSLPTKTYGLDIQINHIVSQKDLDQIYEAVCHKFISHNNVKIYRHKSCEAAHLFNNEYFDWIYIDGDHSLEGVYQDLKLYYDKVKINGYISGDDWDWNKEQKYLVRTAVNRFIKDVPAKLIETKNNQYIIQKT